MFVCIGVQEKESSEYIPTSKNKPKKATLIFFTFTK